LKNFQPATTFRISFSTIHIAQERSLFIDCIMRYSITITGKVQGVWFRNYTKEKADELGICGFVKNLADGSVYCEAEGTPQNLELFADWCGIGSPLSEVKSVNVERKDDTGYTGFAIERNP